MKFKGTRKKLLGFLRSLDREYARQQARLHASEMKVRFFEKHAIMFAQNTDCPVTANHQFTITYSRHEVDKVDPSVLAHGLAERIMRALQEQRK